RTERRRLLPPNLFPRSLRASLRKLSSWRAAARWPGSLSRNRCAVLRARQAGHGGPTWPSARSAPVHAAHVALGRDADPAAGIGAAALLLKRTCRSRSHHARPSRRPQAGAAGVLHSPLAWPSARPRRAAGGLALNHNQFLIEGKVRKI